MPEYGLMGHWKLDHTSGTAVTDSSGGGHTGTVTGTPTWVAGKIGRAFDFDQASVIALGTSFLLGPTQQGSLAAWINFDDTGGSGNGRIIERDNASNAGFIFYLGDSGGVKLNFFNRFANQNQLSTTIMTAGTWYHVGVAWFGTALAFFVNGVAAGTATMSNVVTGGSGITARIGNNAGATLGFDGRIDDVRVYDNQLVAADFLALTNLGNSLDQDPTTVVPVAGSLFKPGVSGDSISAGMPIYKDSDDSNRFKRSRANVIGSAKCDGIAVNTAAAGQPLDYMDSGNINMGTILAVGETYGVSAATAGIITPISNYVAGNFPVVLGVASATNNLRLAIKAAGVAKV